MRNIYIILLFTIVYSRATNLETDWFYDASTGQSFYLFEELIIDSEVFIGDGSSNDEPREDPFTYTQSTLQAFYFFMTAAIEGESLADEDWIGAFRMGYCSNSIANTEENCGLLGAEWNPEEICVGARKWGDCESGSACEVPAMGYDNSEYTMGYMTTGAIPSFKIYDASNDEYLDAIVSDDYPWANQGMFVVNSLENAIVGCLDMDACNYDENANLEGDCSYPEENFDCEGNCLLETDCNGECGGNAADLGCGCFEAGPSGCDMVCGSTAELDECGECGGGGSSCEIPADFIYEQSNQQAFYYFQSVTINGDNVDADDWVGAFNGYICVGAHQWDTSVCGNGICDLPVMGVGVSDENELWMEGYMEPGDIPSFKVFDSSENAYYDAVATEDFPWSNNGIFIIDNVNVVPDCAGELGGGSVLSGCDNACNSTAVVDCAGVCDGSAIEDDCGACDSDPDNDCAQLNIALDGLDLVSFYALPEDNSIENVLGGIEASNPGVLGEATSAIFADGQWIGGLLSIDRQDGYWIKVSDETELNVEGLPTDPGTVYSLDGGFNLISYPFAGVAALIETIPEEAQNSIIGIITENASAYNSEDGWIGGLMDLSGTKGYWFFTSEDVDFTYNPPTADNNLTRQTKYRKVLPEAYTYAQSMNQAFYFVHDAEINGEPLHTDDLIIAYNGDVVVGARYWFGEATDVPAMGADGSIIYAGYGEAGDKITFKVLDASTNTLIEMESKGETAWQNLGMSVIQLTNKVIPEEISFSNAYPNPFNPTTTLSFAIPVDSEVSLSIYNLQGREIYTLINGNMEASYHSVVWNADNHASGIYFVKMVAGEYISIQKLMLVK